MVISVATACWVRSIIREDVTHMLSDCWLVH